MDDRCITGLDSLPLSARAGVVTVGNFDGVHLGHQRILRAARALADANGLRVVAMTFDPPPGLVLRASDVPERITPHEEKARLLLEAGADYVVTVPTTPQLLAMSPDEFARQVVIDRLAPRHVVEGHDFCFGRGRSGNIDTFRAVGAGAGLLVHVVEPAYLDLDPGQGPPRRISSTLVRSLVHAGRVEDANRCLGREFTLYGMVVSGQARGRLLEFPTVNLTEGEQVRPGDGVYAGRAAVAGRRCAAAISVGNKPTFAPAGRAVEAFLLDAKGDFYHEGLALSFLRRLRDQVRFDGVEALKAQIEKDVQRVREICGRLADRSAGASG